MNTDLELNQLLKKYFGFNSFRKNHINKDLKIKIRSKK